MAPKSNVIIGFILAMLLLGILLPIGLNDILEFTSTNSTIKTLITIVLPIMAVLGIVLGFIPKNSDAD